jgi:predicted acylesterase/phospholipase RssA/CRP-like cAMP-binding protein
LNAAEEALLSTSLLAGLSAAARATLLSRVSYRTIRGGDVLVREGETADEMYVLVRGRLRAYVRAGAYERAIGEVARGEPVGEMALFTGEPRSATVRALRDSVVACLSQELFDRLTDEHPRTIMQFARIMLRRARQTADKRSDTPPSTIAVVGADPSSPVGAVATGLMAQLMKIGSTILVDAATADRRFGNGASQSVLTSASGAELASWFDTLEQDHRFVLYQADPTPTEWSMRCVRAADRVLVIADATARPEPAAMEAAIARQDPDCVRASEIVLVRRDGASASGTMRWLEARPRLARHHHVALGETAGYARLARFLSGSAVGLVLSGGGARGFAHIGAIRAMQELGVPIDFIGGASCGAIIGGLAAAGMSFTEMVELNRKAFVDGHAMTPRKDITLPIVSLVTGRRAVSAFEQMFGNRRIEDSAVPYFCVSTNLSRAEIVTHETGPLARCIRASCSPPGVAPPMFENGELLVDGGVLNNLPVDEMLQRCPGKVIAVDVCERIDLKTDSPYCDTLSGWRRLSQMLMPGAKRYEIPGIVAILTRTAMVSSIHRLDGVMGRIDKYLHPPVDKFGGLQWDAIEEIADAGYRYTLAELANWGRP